MATHRLALNFNAGSATNTATVEKSADGENNRDLAIAASTTQQVVYDLDVSALKIFYVLADKACTLKTNSSSAPDTTISLAAGVPFVWYEGCGHANPFGSTDITALYAVNGAGAVANVTLRTLFDSTP